MSSLDKNAPPFTFSRSTIPHEEHPERNEDAVLVDHLRGLAAVFDGVGGSGLGAVGAHLAAKATRNAWKQIYQHYLPDNNSQLLLLDSQTDIEALLTEALMKAQQVLVREGERRAGLGASDEKEQRYPETTIVACAFFQQPGISGYSMGYAHVGDSRIYLLRPDKPLLRLTQDDGYFLLKIEDHTITQEDALRIDQATHEDQLSQADRAIFDKRNGITQSLGHLTPKNPALTIHTAQVTIEPGDRILLCSDGIHDNLTDAEIEAIMRRGARTTIARHLVQQALNRSHEKSLRSKSDDMSAVVVTL